MLNCSCAPKAKLIRLSIFYRLQYFKRAHKLLKQERIPFYVYWASCVNMIFKRINTKFITNTQKFFYKYITRKRDKKNNRKQVRHQ